MHLSIDSSFLLSVERRVPFTAIVSANKRGEKLERKPGSITRSTHSGTFKPAEALGVNLSLQ